ncbi:phosphatase PAP2 family protein [bacterium]|nr:phosphatase PAP2 family protein [bacterium]
MELQIQYLLLLQDFRELTNGIFNQFFISSTWLGEIIIPFTFLSIIYWGINKKAGEFLFLVFGINLYFNVFLKMFACIPRPWILDERICPIKSVMPMADGYSFPSGHTAGAMSTWGGTAFYFWKNKILRWIMITFVCLVAFSRNYVGVHTPQDVIVSIIVGIAVILATSRIQKWLNKKTNNDIIFYIIILISGILLCTYLQISSTIQMQNYDATTDLVNPLLMKHSAYGKIGFYFGLFTGWFLERKYIKFEIIEKWDLKKVLLIGFGIILLFGSSTLIKHILLNYIEYRFVSLVISIYVGIFMTFLYPSLLKLYKLNTNR